MGNLLEAAKVAIGSGSTQVRAGSFEPAVAPEPVHVNGLTGSSTQWRVISADGTKTPITGLYNVPNELTGVDGSKFTPTLQELAKALKVAGRKLADEAGITGTVAVQCYSY